MSSLYGDDCLPAAASMTCPCPPPLPLLTELDWSPVFSLRKDNQG